MPRSYREDNVMDTDAPQQPPAPQELDDATAEAHKPFPLVGVGASAGGLQALQQFFSHMPADTGMAFVIILHLSPTHDSSAAALLQHTTAMPVIQVTESVAVSPNHVYVIPPTQDLSMRDGSIQVQDRDG